MVILNGKLTIIGGRSLTAFNDAISMDPETLEWHKSEAKLLKPRTHAERINIPTTFFNHCPKDMFQNRASQVKLGK